MSAVAKKGQSTSVRIDKELHRKASLVAVQRSLDLSVYLGQILAKHVLPDWRQTCRDLGRQVEEEENGE